MIRTENRRLNYKKLPSIEDGGQTYHVITNPTSNLWL